MAQFWDDFSGDTAGQQPANWAHRIVSGSTATLLIAEDATAPGGKKAVYTAGSTSDRNAFVYTPAGNSLHAQLDIRVLVRTNAPSAANAYYFGPAARVNGTGAADLSLVTHGLGAAGTSISSRNARAAYYSAGSITFPPGEGVIAWANETIWLHMVVNGSTSTIVVEDESFTELTTHTFTDTNINSLASGEVGLFSFRTGGVYDILAFSVGTDGDQALTSAPVAAGPSLTTPTLTATGETTATGAVTTDTATGTLYAYVSTSATAPSAADLKAGTGAVWSGNQAISTTGEKTFSATGLTADTTYHIYYLHNDGTDDSSIVTASATTDAAATPISFSGTVSNQSYVEDAAITPLDLSGFFSGSETPFSYAVTTGTLPAGLSLNASTGVISGTPTTPAAAVSIVVTATDAGTDTAATNAFDITITAAVAVVKGVRVRLYDAAGAAAASITGIQCAWFDQPEPKDFLAPELVTSTASTDVDGWLEIDLDSATALAVGADGFLVAYKLDAVDAQDSQVFAGRLTVEDIA